MMPRIIIENTYGINIQKPRENEDQSRPPTAEEMLSAYASKNIFFKYRKEKVNDETSREINNGATDEAGSCGLTSSMLLFQLKISICNC